jgi:hypothetical protein
VRTSSPFHGAIAICGIGLAMAGCNRGGLKGRSADGGVLPSGPEVPDAAARDLATDPEVDAWDGWETRGDGGQDPQVEPAPDAAHEAAPEAGPDVSRETGPELGAETGAEVGPEARPEAASDVSPEVRPELGREVGSEAGAEAGPPPCTPASQDAHVLAQLNAEAFTSRFAILGDTLFVGMQSPGVSSGSIVSVSLSTGATTTFSIGPNLARQIVAVPGALIYRPGRIGKTDAGTYQHEYTEIARLDLASKEISILDDSGATSTADMAALVGNAKGDVFWSMFRDASGQAVLKRWNEATRQPEIVMLWGMSTSMLIDEDRLYWSELTSSRQAVFKSLPTAGGEVTQLYESPSSYPDVPTLAAVDDQRLYYLFARDPTVGIMAMPKDGGEGQTVVPDANPRAFASYSIDDRHLYWTDWSDQATLRRIAKTGTGEVEVLWSGRGISDIAVDACNVYWTAEGPNEVFVRAK